MRPEPGTGKLVPVLAGDELVEMLGWPDAPPLELDDFVSVPSFDVHGELALSLARRVVEHAARPAVRGVVVPHAATDEEHGCDQKRNRRTGQNLLGPEHTRFGQRDAVELAPSASGMTIAFRLS